MTWRWRTETSCDICWNLNWHTLVAFRDRGSGQDVGYKATAPISGKMHFITPWVEGPMFELGQPVLIPRCDAGLVKSNSIRSVTLNPTHNIRFIIASDFQVTMTMSYRSRRASRSYALTTTWMSLKIWKIFEGPREGHGWVWRSARSLKGAAVLYRCSLGDLLQTWLLCVRKWYC